MNADFHFHAPFLTQPWNNLFLTMQNSKTWGGATNKNKNIDTLPDKHSQTAFYSSTHLELLKVSSCQKQTQASVWTHNAQAPFSPSHVPFLQLGKKILPLQSVRALNSLPNTDGITWGYLLSWGGSFVTDAERGHLPHSDTPEYPVEKIHTYCDSTCTSLCLMCSRAFLLLLLTVFYVDTCGTITPHRLPEWNPGYQQVSIIASPHSHAQGLNISTTNLQNSFLKSLGAGAPKQQMSTHHPLGPANRSPEHRWGSAEPTAQCDWCPPTSQQCWLHTEHWVEL